MSEHDLKLGGMAATKFSAKNSYSDKTAAASGGYYNNSDQVRDFYLNESSCSNNADREGKNDSKNVPDFWESRQKHKELQAKQMGVFAKDSVQTSKQLQSVSHAQSTTNGDETVCKDGHDSDDIPEPEVAIVQIATHALETLAKSLAKRKVSVPMEDRAAFARAVKQAMDVMAKS